jgi:hypothetical protein
MSASLDAYTSNCSFCDAPYDRAAHRPILLCKLHHTVCKDCFDKLNKICPFCREYVDPMRATINHHIYQQLPHDTGSKSRGADSFYAWKEGRLDGRTADAARMNRRMEVNSTNNNNNKENGGNRSYRPFDVYSSDYRPAPRQQ